MNNIMFKFTQDISFLMGIAIKKGFSAFLIAILSSGLILTSFGVVHAESSIIKPSVPDFTLKLVDHSYDVPPIYSKDPYTGKNVMTSAGYHVENKSIEVTIKNQPFTNYKDANGNVIMLFYNVRWKGHFEDYWHTLSIDLRSHINSTALPLVASSSLMADNVLVFPNAPFTVMSYALGENPQYTPSIGNVSAGGQIDFQVQAFIGYHTTLQGAPSQFSPRIPEYQVFTGESSGWSDTQTLTIDSNSASSDSQNPTASSDQSGLNWTEIALFTALGVIVVLVIVVVALVRRRRSLQTSQSK